MQTESKNQIELENSHFECEYKILKYNGTFNEKCCEQFINNI